MSKGESIDLSQCPQYANISDKRESEVGLPLPVATVRLKSHVLPTSTVVGHRHFPVYFCWILSIQGKKHDSQKIIPTFPFEQQCGHLNQCGFKFCNLALTFRVYSTSC